MYTVYHLKANELDNSFLEALKMILKNKEIEIVVSEAGENGVGEQRATFNGRREHRPKQESRFRGIGRRLMRKIAFEASAFEDFTKWATADKKLHCRIVNLIMDTMRRILPDLTSRNRSNMN